MPTAADPTPADDWEDPSAHPSDGDEFIIDVAGFEGPLDLLLHLARKQKVDLSRISVLALAEQYLDFIAGLRSLRLELAADYLVMAAWLAFLKSKLLMPAKPAEPDAESGEEMAAVLQFRLRRLDAMRRAGERLMSRNRLGRDVFARGQPERSSATGGAAYSACLHDLLTAYAERRQRGAVARVRIAERRVWGLKEARELLERMLGSMDEWTALDSFLCAFATQPRERRTALASSFAASLELAREGRLELRQDEPFGPLLVRSDPRSKPRLGIAP